MLGWFALVSTSLFNAALLSFVYKHSHFVGDDLIALFEAHSLPFLRFVLSPISEHFVPLHRLTTYVLDALAPLDFRWALLTLYGFQVLGAFYMYRILLLLEGETLDAALEGASSTRNPFRRLPFLATTSSWLLLAGYGTHLFISSLYLWWTAGLHRLPYIAFAAMSIYYYLRYRRTRETAALVLSALSSVCGLGFFDKAVLVPLYLLGIEGCLWNETPRRDRVRNLKVLSAFLLASAGYVLAWRYSQPGGGVKLNTDLNFQLEFLKTSWLVFRNSIVGSLYTERSDPLALPFAVWVALVTYTVTKRPRTALVWAVLVCILVVNVLLTSASKQRTGAYGLLIALFSYRYYYELLFLVVIFTAIVFKKVREASAKSAGSGRSVNWIAATASMLAIAFLAWNSYATSTKTITGFYANYGATRAFLNRLLWDTERIRQRHTGPLRIVDGHHPAYVSPWKHMGLLKALGIEAQASAPGPGVYKILDSGNLVPSL